MVITRLVAIIVVIMGISPDNPSISMLQHAPNPVQIVKALILFAS